MTSAVSGLNQRFPRPMSHTSSSELSFTHAELQNLVQFTLDESRRLGGSETEVAVSVDTDCRSRRAWAKSKRWNTSAIVAWA